MNSTKFSSQKKDLTARIFAFFPTLLFTLPAAAEVFNLPACPFPDVLQDQKSLLIDCDKPAAGTAPPATTPTTAAPVGKEKRVKGKNSRTAQNPQSNPNPAVKEAPVPGIVPQGTDATINRLDLFGNTVFQPQEVQALFAPSQGKPASRQELCQVAARVTKAYKDKGYILAQAFPLIDRASDATIDKAGVVRFLAIEGCLEKIEILGNQRLQANYINSRIVAGAATPFNANRINDALASIQTDPKIGKLEVLGIVPGESFGSSKLGLQVTESNSIAGFVGADSYVQPIFGGTRAIGGLTYRNVTSNGDDLNATYFRSTTGEVSGFDFSYQLPLNPMNGQITLRYAPTNSNIVLQPNNQKFTSSSSTSEITYRQPLVRNSKTEFALSFGLAAQSEQTSINGVGANTNLAANNGVTETRIAKFAQEYSNSDDTGAWALRSQFNLGLGVLGATVNPQPRPDGRFFFWQGQVQRVQRFAPDNYAIFQTEVQLSANSLQPNQQFNVGGGQSVRGYRQNVRLGDNGVRVSIEDRTVVSRNSAGLANLQLAVNADAAQIWNGNSAIVDGGFLASVGVGVIWEPIPRLVTRLDYALPLRSITDKGSSFQDSGLSFAIGYGF